MRNPKSWLAPILATGVFLCFDKTRMLGVGCLVILVVVVIEARQDANRRVGHEAQVRAMAAHVKASMAEVNELRRQAVENLEAAEAAKKETERQLTEFEAWVTRQQQLPSPQQLFDQHEEEYVRHKTEVLMSEIEEHLRDV